MKLRSAALDLLAGKHGSLLAFDCEFWHKGESFLPREVGGYHLTRTGDSWTRSAPFFVVLPPPEGQLNRVSSKFSTTTPATAEALDLLEETERSAPEFLGDKDIVDVYFADSMVKPHLKPASWLKGFAKLISESVVVVKGDTDLKAIKNASAVHGFTFKSPLGIMDIAKHNPEFTKRCKTAKLEGTYDCIKKELDAGLKKAFPVGKAHNPVSDAAMAIQIAAWLVQKDVK
jgi:hypothetical protein